ncbi:jasmonate-induced oxygenase 1 [Quercus suber]|uniref:jasmonate-induced oxygenase 1 n=1 Tax=Quercus suber TaxID=58331 RepID=UPI000CE18D43|nr:probable 2-oxoglutarate-dependent dioxygenase At3g111800 [Quercus suber]POF02363.1 putative 2-oxoglutarate-dependent dioxygenase [Quercus suber]
MEMEVGGEPMVRVQAIAEAKLSQVPPQYIQPPHNRPNHHSSTATAAIPTIDLLEFNPTHLPSIRSAIAQACTDYGAFHVTNHGVPTKLLRQIKTTGLTFFNQSSIDDKLTYSCDPHSFASQGYGSRMLLSDKNDTVVLDWRDYFDHHTLPLSRRDPSRWPHFPENYRETVASYSDEMKGLAQKLMGLISESLGLRGSYIEDAVGELYQNITISYYPPCPQPDLTLGLQPHSDMGAITLLIQDDVGGLEVLKDDQWITVDPLSDAILVILADQTEIITNGKYRSAVHRAVTNATQARLSVATFHDPAKAVKISPSSELVNGASPWYREVVYGDYVSSWYTKGPDGKRNIDSLLLN